MLTPTLFRSPFLGGFECSSHRRHDGRRLDLIAATGHDRWAAADYRAMLRHGIRTVRDGVRWHRIETAPGRYDWSSFLPMLRAARLRNGVVDQTVLSGHQDRPGDIDAFAGLGLTAIRYPVLWERWSGEAGPTSGWGACAPAA